MRVEVWSDLVCPWCYVGKRRFERALAGFRLRLASARRAGAQSAEAVAHRDDIQVVHRSFQLDAASRRGTTSPRRHVLMAKYGLSEAQAEAMDETMIRTASADGLEYHLAGGVTGNTFDAHQIVHLAGARDIQDRVIERLYRAHFTEQRSLFEHESLVQLAAEAGLDPDEARDVLKADTYASAVRADVQEAKALGVTGVPFFLVSRRCSVSGAQATAVFIDALERAWTDAGAEASRQG